MKLATLPAENPDGRLVVVSRDLKWCVEAKEIVGTLQEALDHWQDVAPALESLFEKLQRGESAGQVPFSASAVLAPLPRAWQWLDGSAFPSHGALMAKSFGIEEPVRTMPLMYQGMSHQFLSPTEDVPFRSEDDGIDFEGEFAVITGEVPMSASPRRAADCIRLIALVNDWSLRKLAVFEMNTGFGWIHAKPACSMGPVVVTPDELAGAWVNGRVDLALRVDWNGSWFGQPVGNEMSFSFGELVAHAAATRALCAGTLVGSGTVSNSNYRVCGSTCIAERRGIETVDTGAAKTSYMRFGDSVRMEVVLPDGQSLFGSIEQRVIGSSPR